MMKAGWAMLTMSRMPMLSADQLGAMSRVDADPSPASDGTGRRSTPHLQPDHAVRHFLVLGRRGQLLLRVHGQRRGRQAERPSAAPLPRCTACRRSGNYATPADGIFIFDLPNRTGAAAQFDPGRRLLQPAPTACTARSASASGRRCLAY